MPPFLSQRTWPLILRFARLIVFVIVGLALLCLAPSGKASAAEVEFCPAVLGGYHIFGEANAGLISFYVWAESARSVSANVIVEGETDWYTFQFKDVAVLPDVAHYQSPTVRFDRTLYHSKPLYVRFPASERIVRWWIYDAIATGDSKFGWDKQGDVTCFPQRRATNQP
ncbi:MAG: hypothetical protein JO078_10380 [Candidatus Eremiobacteraeota bacterium]|nr:hypothetical protein [Candidatus Eremiobacteraeota bacterium]MBV9057296.1 hypothetical protein [Candidatus Eremiobacteraeota bacterium]MBV9700517.1 hypothetical protein [Candidatus Eremiobacteraeota bacterium]